MYISKNPAKTRPLSANVKRLMRLSRAAPRNSEVTRETRHFTTKDLACCAKQGELFMEAASMGFSMEDFAQVQKEIDRRTRKRRKYESAASAFVKEINWSETINNIGPVELRQEDHEINWPEPEGQ